MFLKIWIDIKIRSIKNLFVFKLRVLALICIIEHKTQESTKEIKNAKINSKLSIRIQPLNEGPYHKSGLAKGKNKIHNIKVICRQINIKFPSYFPEKHIFKVDYTQQFYTMINILYYSRIHEYNMNKNLF